MAMMAASLTAEHRAAISAGVRQSYALDPDGPAKKRAARAKWTWTPEASRALSETRKRMIAEGAIAKPPSSLGGRVRAERAKALYDGDCMSPESRAKQSETQRHQFASGERTISDSTRAAAAAANRGRAAEIAEMNRRRVWTPEMKAKRAATMLARYGALNKPATAETRAKIGAANLGKRRSRPSPLKGRPRSAEIRSKISATVKLRWKEPERSVLQIRAMLEAVNARPNNLERDVLTFLNSHFPLEWKFNSGELFVGTKIPDFIRTDGRRVCIDVFGDYWHAGEDPTTRQEIFAARGYALIVVWEGEFRRSPDSLLMLLLNTQELTT